MAKQSTTGNRYARKKGTSQQTSRTTQKYANTTGILLFPIALLLFAFTILVFNTSFTDALLEHYTHNETAIPATHQLIDYFQNTADMPAIFNAEEQAHMEDVKHLIWAGIIVFFITVSIVTYCVSRGDRRKIVQRGSAALLGFLLLAVVIPFDSVFSGFHRLTFPQGGYTFPIDSTIIQFYPSAFFAAYAASIAGLALAVAGLLYFLEIVSRRG